MKIVEVSAAIIHDGKEVFVTQRGYGEFKDGWEFPGGKIEVGESKEECIVREIREELGIQIVI
ncbi:MAG: NUDIX domain-containing protein, partial [Candidatus Enteromonas sp.]|nr:NUDIX domain-containing protein [Candidatus Enteromonas sp.]